MRVDHIFIFTNKRGEVANELVEFGLNEGSSRVHAGQGTTNRKFYFSNFFLEVLWVHEEGEIKSEKLGSTGLWQRAEYQTNAYSPFGLCLVNTSDTDALFATAHLYQPDYFPAEHPIAILQNAQQPTLPWTFRLPFKGQKSYDIEPQLHPNGLTSLTKAIFEYQGSTHNSFLQHFEAEDQIVFRASTRNWLTLVFDQHQQNQERVFKKLWLTIRY